MAAEQGNAEAQAALGGMYYFGNGVLKSVEEAVEWTEKAAEQGDTAAQRNMGFMYYNGEGVEQSYETAAKWYTKAAGVVFYKDKVGIDKLQGR
jgi:TPR repeat protein